MLFSTDGNVVSLPAPAYHSAPIFCYSVSSVVMYHSTANILDNKACVQLESAPKQLLQETLTTALTCRACCVH